LNYTCLHFVLLTKYVSDQIEKNKTGWSCSTYGDSRVYIGFWWGNLMERDHLKGPGLDGRIILRWIFRKSDVGEQTGSIWFMTGTGAGHF
jgi:hypothetical protein